MPYSIGFRLSLEPSNTEAQNPCANIQKVSAALLVDGEPALIGEDVVLNIGLVLALGATAADEFYPFTCSCGVPGCVGIHRGARIDVSEHEVTWTLPAKPFCSMLRADLAQVGSDQAPGADPVIRFERPQYEEAIETAICELERLMRETARAVDIWPGSMDDGCATDRRPGLREALLEQREQLIARQMHDAWRERVFGDLLAQELVLTLSCGQSWTLPCENLAEAAVSDGYGLDDEEMQRIECDIAPVLHSGFGGIVRVARAIPWPHLASLLFSTKDSPPSSFAEKLKDWPELTFSVRRMY